MTVFRCAAAVLDGEVVPDVDISATDGIITAISRGPGAAPVDEWLPGLVVPAFADAHSHVFHRGLRGRTHDEGGSFWTWRDRMYTLADRLDPDRLYELALAAYVEMVCAGVTAVGEFHYLHHGPGGAPYADPNLMGLAVSEAGRAAGLQVTLLDVAYLAGGFGQPVGPSQRRFSDGTVQAWAERVGALPDSVRSGVAIHSVRAVPPTDLGAVAAAAGDRVVHVHLSEQPAENDACLAATGRTPTGLLADAGVLSPRLAAVHATHLTDADIALLGAAGATAVICPSTEADLADGLPRAGDLAASGVRLALGSDQHVQIDPIAQARGLEYGERLATGRRGHFAPSALLTAATADSHAAIGSAAGRIGVGAPADLVALDRSSVRTAGSLGLQLLLSASAADVRVVVTAGVVQARDGVHVRWGDPGPLLARAIERAWA
ncbi:formimidoylglutamate deiminase [Nakamurella sp. YIM 132087]|uniref:Formimidoylglutamate deiminase n=1 Tax=Nakamurella alba TaxID=2665158 RepID=A0A7K1FFV9_9ACTN|nr:formimidoylglutamate deiminase [Nakamurella alba]MTD13005.1 formimidoylglutamate deiminase [Nakamurella alba]